MTDPIHEQLSAFIDDELSSEECAFLVRRLDCDKSSRSQLVRYAAIGSVIRGEITDSHSDDLRRRVQTALAGGNPAAAPTATAAPASRRDWIRPVAGGAIAAAVALVALAGLRTINQVPTEAAGFGQPGLTAGTSTWEEPDMYTVPDDAVDNFVISPPIRLTNYLMYHGNYASPLGRTSVHSNVVGTTEAGVDGDGMPVTESDR